MRLCTALLVKEFFSIDVSEAAEEGQGAQGVGVSDAHVPRHPLDQTSETLQLCHHVDYQHRHVYLSLHLKRSLMTGVFNRGVEIKACWDLQDRVGGSTYGLCGC